MPKVIWVVEDDESISALLEAVLVTAGYNTSCFYTAKKALKELINTVPDLMLFDIMLPDIDGITAVKLIRQNSKYKDMKIIMLTALGTDEDKIKGLDAGADDYITKPFSVPELCARVRANLRGAEQTQEDKVSYKNLSVDYKKHTARINNIDIALTQKEFKLLKILIQNRERVVEREELLVSVWGYEYIGETRTLDIHIGTLRQKLKDNAAEPEYIKTVRGVGYSFLGEE